MSPVEVPPQLSESVPCCIAAAARYGIPAQILLAVAEQEAGMPGQWVQNRNGTSDVGPMQFNTAYLATLRKYGITPQAVAAPGCYAYNLAAWRLHQHIQLDQGDLWTRAANYHSRTPRHNARYRADLMAKSVRWADWLERCATGSCPSSISILLPSAATATLPLARQVDSQTSYVPRAIVASPAR